MSLLHQPCWIEDTQRGFIGGTILKQQDDNLIIIDKDNNEHIIPKNSILLQNPPNLQSTDNLTSLSHLNEPSILNAIKIRYSQLNIYTLSGIVLIATNPFDNVLSLYSDDMILAYHSKKGLDPHLFSIAQQAFLSIKSTSQNQTIIVSGESGAGKTVSAKFIMRYFAKVSESDTDFEDKSGKSENGKSGKSENGKSEGGDGGDGGDGGEGGATFVTRSGADSNFLGDLHGDFQNVGVKGGETRFGKKGEDSTGNLLSQTSSHISSQISSQTSSHISSQISSDSSFPDIENQILATNPIMESFGNAKTTRNDNSSRFGKYLEILFNSKTKIIGARIKTYLLERSRLVYQPNLERNYHIFYQLLVGLNKDEKDKLGLLSSSDYLYTSGQSIIPGVNDLSDFNETKNALSLIGINSNKQFQIFQILAALLHIGNINIIQTKNDSQLSSNEPNLIKACDLLGIDSNNFTKWCIKKQIQTRSEKIISNLNYSQSIVSRDSFAKYIYSALFDWLVDFINQDLCPESTIPHIKNFIGVLDIYGFEHFEKNSFEQFCINYANEKLQQEFNKHVFKLEQEEYIKEEIKWNFIDFSDNQPCINLIESRLGVLSLLDEESRLPSGNDESWIEKMYQTLNKDPTNKVFKKPRFGQNKFIISHYALDVTYDIEGFIEKNRDTVGEGHLEVLKNSKNDLLQSILSIIEKNSESIELKSTTRKVIKKPTLGSMFKNSLIDLMKTINSTNVHYIRCIKPNENKKPWEFDPLMVLSQLRACGVLETIRISCAGFPSRWSYVEFADRYHILVPSNLWIKVMSEETTKESVNELCNNILKQNIDDNEKYQLGNTKIFFKAGLLAQFEKLRSDKLHNSAVMIQKNLKRVYYQKKYNEIRSSHINLQSLIRGFIERQRIKHEKQTKAATLIQTLIRGFIVRQNSKQTLESVIKIQKSIRGFQGRLKFNEFKKERSAIIIQKSWNGYTVRRDYKKKLNSTIKIQSAFRRKLAYKEVKQLRTEAKSVNNLKEVSYKLENKVIDLTQSLTSKIHENKGLLVEITNLKNILEQQKSAQDVLKTREIEIQSKFDDKDVQHIKEVENLNKELATLKSDYNAAELKIEELSKEHAELRQQVQTTITELKEAKDALVKRDTIEVDLKSHVEKLKSEIALLTAAGVTNSKINGISNGKIRENKTSGDTKDTRTVSVIAVSNDDESNLDDINDELFKLLRDSRQLHREIVDGLLKGLKIPTAGVAVDLTRKEVLFPARIIIIILSDMWRLGLTKESEEFLGEVLSSIQTMVTQLKDDEVIANGAFWLSNTHELYSFVAYAQEAIIANETLSNEMSEEEFEEYLKLVAVVKEDFESLSYNIYNMWMKKLEKIIEKKSLTAILESQSLPGFMAPESSPFLSKVFPTSTQYKMDDIIAFFNSVYWSIKSYFIEHEVMVAVIVELLRYIDAFCFNDLIMRRNFLSWKRGLQLNYNITRLEEWCKSHEINEASYYLCHLLQTAKLLQLRKNTKDDIDILYEICYSLKPIQIQKIVSQYYIADYETPIDPNILRILAENVKAHGSEGADLFEVVSPNGHFVDPFRMIELRPFSRVEAYVPAWLNLPVIRRIVELVAKNASSQEENTD